MKLAKRNLRAVIQHLKNAEKELHMALEVFVDLPVTNRNREMRKLTGLVETVHRIQRYQFDFPHEFGEVRGEKRKLLGRQSNGTFR